MKKFVLILSLVFIQYTVFCAETPFFRYGIFVSSSKGLNENNLSNAVKEINGVARLFKEYCRRDDCQILDDPGSADLTAAFKKAAQIIGTCKDAFETQLFFYYFGHGLPDGLLLGNELYDKAILKKQLAAIDARIKFVFIDACSSEIMGDGDYLDFRAKAEGTVFITSSGLFEKAFTDIFTPILSAGLMGDADGFIPEEFAAPFFYSEISTKLSGEEKDFIQDKYGFKEYYDYRTVSPEKEKAARELFTSLGIKDIPRRPHADWIYEKLLPGIRNSLDKKLIETIYNYSEVCPLDKALSPADKARIILILGKVGFEKDNFVTLPELFSYIRARVTEKKIFHQTPTINTNLLAQKEPVRLSYNDNKIKVILKYPGTILVHRITDKNLLEQLLTLTPRLGDGAPVSISLPPDNYTFIIERDGVQYRLDKKLAAGDSETVLDFSDPSSMIIYNEKNFFSYSYGIGGSVFVTKAQKLIIGAMPVLTAQYNFSFPWGIIGLGIMTGMNWQTTTTDTSDRLDMIAYPIALYGRFITRFTVPYFLFLDIGGGGFFEQWLFSNSARENDWGDGVYLTTGLGGGVKLSPKMSLALKGHFSWEINNIKNDFTALVGIDLINKL